MKLKNQGIGMLLLTIFLFVFSAIASERVWGDSKAQSNDALRQVVDMEVSPGGQRIWRIWNDGTVESMFPLTAQGSGEWIRESK